MVSILFFCYGLLAIAETPPPVPIPLLDAMQKGRVKVIVRVMRDSLPGETLELQIDNQEKKPLLVDIPAGLLLESNDSTQNMLLIRSQEANLIANGQRKIRVRAMCINASRTCPSAETIYRPKEMAIGHLADLAKVANTKRYGSRALQHAIWAITDKHELYGIYDETGKEERPLQEFMSKLLNKPIPTYTVRYRDDGQRAFVREAVSLQGSLKFKLDKAENCSFYIVDSSGQRLMSSFENSPFARGTWSTKFSLKAHFLTAGETYSGQLVGASGNVISSFKVTI